MKNIVEVALLGVFIGMVAAVTTIVLLNFL